MKVLTVYANPNPRSFCHAILEQFSQGLENAGHTNEVVDLYAMKFDPVLKLRDYTNWIERVFTYGFAYSLTSEGWQGEIKGRVPLFKHEKALIISTTLFNEKAYQSGLSQAMKRLIDDFGFRYPGIKNVNHVYFYSVGEVDAATRQNYLQQAYRLGK